ncbi:MAG: DUF2207 domain-containing protein [Cloacibacillus sp.]
MTAAKRLCAALAALFLITAPASAAEVIKEFTSNVQIRKDSALEVTERLLINVENITIRRGIVRSFPIYYTDKDGRSFEVGFDVQSVTLDGAEVPWSVEYEGDYANLRIGDKNVMVPQGLRKYVIRYVTTRQVGFFEQFDELYWNATGNHWSWPILNASCTVSLPQEEASVPFRSIEWYVGRYGEKGDPAYARLSSKNTVSSTKTLYPGEGMTVVYTFPKGLVSEPAPFFGNTRAQWMIAAAALIAVLSWLAFSFFTFVKRVPVPAVIARFYPPDDASPACVRNILESTVDQTSFTANVMALAVKGALKIISSEKSSIFGTKTESYTLEKESSPAKLTADEEAMYETLFEDGADSVKIEQKNAVKLSACKNAMAGNVAVLCDGFTKSYAKIAVTAVLMIAAGIAALTPFTGESATTVACCAAAAAVTLLVGFMRGLGMKPRTSSKIFSAAVTLVIGAAVTVIAAGLAESMSEGGLPVILFGASAAAAAAALPFLTQWTERGAEIYSEAEGLKLYISVAEKARMEMLDAPDETPELFERLLPYAVATGEVKAWSARFESVLAKADYKPSWYVGATPYLFLNAGGFNSFANDLNRSITSGMTKPSSSPTLSSGSGGGGFSGGGGGGGGGSGW